MNISAEEIMRKAVEAGEGMDHYYTLSESKVYQGTELMEHSILEEYVANGKRKTITHDQLEGEDKRTEALNDGAKTIIYDKYNHRAFEMDITADGDVESHDSTGKMNGMMGITKDTHALEIIGEEKILDFDTFHIEAKAKISDHVFGDTDLWVDQKTRFIIKMISEVGGIRTELDYKKIDISPVFAEDTFTLNIPDDVEIKDLEAFAPDTVTLAEAEEILKQSFYLFPEDEFILKDIEMHHIDGIITRDELNLTYYSKADMPMFYLSIFHSPEGMEIEKADVEIRGRKAAYEKVVNSITWDEEGLRYSIIMIGSEVEKNEMIERTESMVLNSDLNKQP
ncbi:LolA family protein [Oceanobacillus oncorhynchi]|uniref:LolA family protein n=2 Tax=Oceanobacillus TaxID=182709 RepID=UPI002115D349|nr:outer membrane lipoprotein-sorting protein [Oceanobacillus oncorhynchi]UUI41809.1 outer membrane lipoprotein-sorting protein [Oceanobacillus oncorhynchi]